MGLVVNFMLRPFYRQQKNTLTYRIGGGRAGLDFLEKRKISWPCRDSKPGTKFNPR